MLLPGPSLITPAGFSYQNFTPSLSVLSGTPPTLGTGSTAVSRFAQLGKMVHYYGKILFGSSGAAAGSGVYLISLPVNAAGAIAIAQFNAATMLAGPTGNTYLGICDIRAANGLGFFGVLYGTPTVPISLVGGPANPFSWGGNGDEITWDFNYEAA